MPELKILLDHPDAKIPRKAHKGDAGADLHAVMPDGVSQISIPPGSSTLIPTGLKFDIPPGYEVQVRPRSGLALKHGVTVLNAPGTIDAGYRGPVGVILINHHHTDHFIVEAGDRIAQIVVAQVAEVDFVEVDDFDGETTRGERGYGSTGVR